jgi:hypothetical protein
MRSKEKMVSKRNHKKRIHNLFIEKKQISPKFVPIYRYSIDFYSCYPLKEEITFSRENKR